MESLFNDIEVNNPNNSVMGMRSLIRDGENL